MDFNKDTLEQKTDTLLTKITAHSKTFVIVVVILLGLFALGYCTAAKAHGVKPPPKVIKPVVEKPIEAVTGGGASGGYFPLLVALGFFAYIVHHDMKCRETPGCKPKEK